MKENVAVFPKPPVDLQDLATQADIYGSWVIEAADGAKSAKARCNAEREKLLDILLELGHYAEARCNRNPDTLRLSGFEPLPPGRKLQSVISEDFRSIRPGPNSGTVLVRLINDADAFHQELRYKLEDSDDTPEAWTVLLVGQTRQPRLIENLTPGKAYVFEARRLVAGNQYTDWSDPIRYIVT
ncbi:MAG TPA: hypothetical protein VKY31_10760 [Terriglobia bacterium]|jgi:hypothetical protein|nr:hypothetical protein [Terriglobia bacterium]